MIDGPNKSKGLSTQSQSGSYNVTKQCDSIQARNAAFPNYSSAIRFYREHNPCRLHCSAWIEFGTGTGTKGTSGIDPADLWAAVAQSVAVTSAQLDTPRRAVFQLCLLGRPIGPIHPIDAGRLMRKSVRTIYRWQWDAIDQFERQLKRRGLLGE